MGWFLASLLVLLILLVILVRLPSVQNALTQRAINFLEKKIKTDVDLKSIYIEFPTKVVLEGLYVEDQHQDTLLYAGKLTIDTDLWGLTHHSIQLNRVGLEECNAVITRTANDSLFNFNYIIAAFSTPKTTEPSTTNTAWKFSIDKVNLSSVDLVYDDAYTGNTISVALGDLEVRLNEFDIEKSVYRIASLNIANAKAYISQNNVYTLRVKTNDQLPADTSALTIPLTLGVDEIDFKNVDFKYTDVVLGQRLNASVGELFINAKEFDLNRQVINLREVRLAKSFISVQSNANANGAVVKKTGGIKTDTSSFDSNFPWHITVSRLDFSDNGFQNYDFSTAATAAAIDFNHLWIIGLQTSADDIELYKNKATLNLKNLSFREQKGFALQSLSTNFSVTDTHLTLKSFQLLTGQSKVTMEGQASYPSLHTLADQYGQVKINLNVTKSVIALKDVLLFYPTLIDSLPIKLPASTTATLNTKVQGKLNNITVPFLTLKTLDSTSLDLYGNIKGLPHLDESTVDVKIKKLFTTQHDLSSILPDSLLTSFQIPRWLSLSAKGSGLVKAPKFQAALTSSAGSLDAEGNIDMRSTPQYDVVVNTKELNLGKILKQDSTMGMLEMKAVVKGSGLSLQELDTKFDITIFKFQYAQYDYRDFKLNGTLSKYLFSGKAELNDKNLDFALTGDMDYQPVGVPLYKFKLDLKNADFKALHLTERPLKTRAILDVKLATSDFKVLNGNVDLRKVAVYNGQALYMVDSLLFASIDQKGESNISIRSDIVSGDFKGSFNIFSLPRVLRKHIDHYFSLQDSSISKTNEPQKFTFDLTIKDTDLLTEILLPGLEPFVPGEIKGEFDSELDKLDIKIALSTLKYNTIGTDSLSLKITSNKEALKYSLSLKNIVLDTLRIPGLDIGGKIAHDSIRTNLTLLDSLYKEIYVLGGVIRSEQNKFRFHFMPNEVMLNYARWTVPLDNYLQFGSVGILAHNFNLSKGSEKIALLTTSKDSLVSLNFEHLKLSNITKIVAGTVPADGIVNGDIKFTTSGSGDFSSKLSIKELTILKKKWGDATFNMSHTQAHNRYTVDLNVVDQKSNLKASGYYIPHDKASEFNVSIALSPLDLQLIEPLSVGQLKNVNGTVEGTVKLTGTTVEPILRGELHFKQTSFLLSYLNTRYSLNNEVIEFKEAGIGFSNFTIKDEKNNEAVIKGNILTKAYKDFDLNLRIATKNFKVLQTTEDNSKLYYGNVSINATARVAGNFTQPRVTLGLSLTPGSTVTYIVPQTQKMVLEQKGIVQFIDKDAIKDPFLATINLEDTIQSVFKGVELTANLELTDKEILNIVIDPATGDKLSVQGNSTLTLDIDASGNMDLAGRYEITKGTYNFSFYKLVKRKFDIVKGSTITWAGNPLNAALDIRASNTVETSPLELVSNQLTSTNQQELNTYKQRLPFLIYLNIRGQLLTPEISFELDMPNDKRNAFGGAIYAKIQDINSRESDLNKQVFALLILKRFISDNPLDSQGGSDLNNTARMSVSRLLSEQLNRLSENVKGVQLTVDLKSYEDYSTGQAQGQTKVQLGLSKNLFNDRLVVKLAGNLDIEGETSTQQNVTDYIGDLALEYKLTSDGRFRITGFRNSNYDMINGELTETGAGLIYIKDYNAFRELFRANAKEN